mgnify:FL=1
MKNLKSTNGITLIALVITIILLLILAGIGISMITSNTGLINKAETSSKETEKGKATETLNFKITTAQIKYYSENQHLPTLQYLANELCNDKDIEYVKIKDKKVASTNLPLITVGENDSILTKLEAYPYEFEINNSLQLASIDGIKISTVPKNDEDTIVSMTKSELKSLIASEVNSQLSKKSYSNIYSSEEVVIGTWIDGRPIYRKVVSGTTKSQTVAFSNPGVTSGDNLIDYYGVVKASDNNWGNINYNGHINLFWSTPNSDLRWYITYNSFENRPFRLVVEYVKSTDEVTTTE